MARVEDRESWLRNHVCVPFEYPTVEEVLKEMTDLTIDRKRNEVNDEEQ